MLAALFRATKIPGGFPTTASGVALELLVYVAIVVLPWYFLTKRADSARTKFRDAFVFMILGLLVIIGQSSSTWTLTDQASHQISLFFESYALVICWLFAGQLLQPSVGRKRTINSACLVWQSLSGAPPLSCGSSFLRS